MSFFKIANSTFGDIYYKIGFFLNFMRKSIDQIKFYAPHNIRVIKFIAQDVLEVQPF
jgi:hypothetical protein